MRLTNKQGFTLSDDGWLLWEPPTRCSSYTHDDKSFYLVHGCVHFQVYISLYNDEGLLNDSLRNKVIFVKIWSLWVKKELLFIALFFVFISWVMTWIYLFGDMGFALYMIRITSRFIMYNYIKLWLWYIT